MKIRFYDGDDKDLGDILIEEYDYFEGARVGHQMIYEEVFPGAEDFQIEEDTPVYVVEIA